jgi:hypothetical protein
MPDADSITFKALQSYFNGDIVRWIDEPKAGQPEPDHPAPTLKLAKADHAAQAAAAPPTSNGGSSTTATLALVFAIIALVVALGGARLVLMHRRKASNS